MEPESSLPRLKEPITCPYCEPDQSTLFHPAHFLKIPLNISRLHLGLPNCLLPEFSLPKPSIHLSSPPYVLHARWHLKHPQPTYLPPCKRPCFTSMQNNGQNYSSAYLYLYILGYQTARQKSMHLMIVLNFDNIYFSPVSVLAAAKVFVFFCRV